MSEPRACGQWLPSRGDPEGTVPALHTSRHCCGHRLVGDTPGELGTPQAVCLPLAPHARWKFARSQPCGWVVATPWHSEDTQAGVKAPSRPAPPLL